MAEVELLTIAMLNTNLYFAKRRLDQLQGTTTLLRLLPPLQGINIPTPNTSLQELCMTIIVTGAQQALMLQACSAGSPGV